MDFNKSVGEILREAREKKELLLRQVSAKLDVDTAIISKIERNERRATRQQIIGFAEILDLNKDDLLNHYFSEKIMYEIENEDSAIYILKITEEKLQYKRTKKN